MAPRTEHLMVRPTTTPSVTRITPQAGNSTDRSFKVLQSSRAPAQLSLFPPPGSVRAAR
jgi:hypothetical protein